MRKIKTIDDITKDGKVEFGEGYEFVSTAEEADAILMRSTDLHGYELPEGIRAIARCGAGEAEANCADMAISELKDYLENGNIAHSVNYPACSMGKARAASRIACLHANVPNMIGQITAILAKDNANVQRMTNESAGENAYTMFDTDEHLDTSTIEALKQIPSMYRVRVIK